MKSTCTTIIALVCILMSSIINAQQAQSNFINYQGVARDAAGEVLSDESINLQLSIHIGDPDASASYIENHTVTTDATGVFNVRIGDGTPLSGDYETLDFDGLAPFLRTSLNGSEVGVTEMLAVPYSKNAQFSQVATDMTLDQLTNVNALTPSTGQVLKYDGTEWVSGTDDSGIDSQWVTSGDNISYDAGSVGINRDPSATLDVNGSFRLQNGTSVNEVSTDGALGGNSDNAVPTERAVKTYVDNATETETPVTFKVRGQGFAAIELDVNTTVETDFWNLLAFDTRNAFNTTTKRYVIPETGYYYLHAVVRQSNFVTSSFFRITFNVDTGINYNTIVDGDDVKTELSGIYFLTAGQQVYVNLRNFGDQDVNVDGFGSWFEGYKIN